MPTDKRARQKAARQAKKLAQRRRARRRRLARNSGFVAVGAVVVIVIALATTGVFSSSKPPSSTPTTSGTAQSKANTLAVAAGCPKTPKTRVNTLTWSSPPALTITATKTYTATVKTTAGTFTLSLDAKTAPTVVNNFVFLADHGYYKCNIFHRVIPGFMDQTGDPTGTGTGNPGYHFANQNVPTAYAAGEVAMANSGGTDSNGAQFFILVTGGQSTLNSDLARGDKYAVLGSVTKGMAVVKKINADGNATPTANGTPPKVIQRMLSVTVHSS